MFTCSIEFIAEVSAGYMFLRIFVFLNVLRSNGLYSAVPVAAHSKVARLLRSWVRIPPWAWMIVCCECCVLSGRGLCDELITRPEESYRL